MRVLLPIAFATALLIAGCVEEAPSSTEGGDALVETSGQGPSASGSTSSTTLNTTALEGGIELALPEEIVYYLTADGGLSREVPAEGVYAASVGILSPEFFTEGRIPPHAAPSLPQGMRIMAAKVDVFYSTPGVLATMEPLAGFSGVAAFLGEGDRNDLLTIMPGPPALTPGTVVHAEGEAPERPGGFVLERGAPLHLVLGFIYTQSTAAPIHVHVGGEQATRVTLTTLAYDHPAGGATTEIPLEGPLGPPNGDATSNTHEFPLTLAPGTTRVEVTLAGHNGAPGRHDLDISLMKGDTVVAASVGPTANEVLRAYDVNGLAEGGEFTLRLFDFGSTNGHYVLTVKTTGPVAS